MTPTPRPFAPPLRLRRPTPVRFLRFALALLAALAGVAVAPSRSLASDQPGAASEAVRFDLDRLIAQHMEEGGIVGLSAVIIVDKKVVWQKGYGFADQARRLPFTPDTVLNIGSISKTITGAAMMRAVQDGKVDLDEDISLHLPFAVRNPLYPDDKITLRQLATHTSGITDRWAVYRNTYCFNGAIPTPLGEFLKDYFVAGGVNYSPENFLQFKPGTHREYSNIGAGLAGYVVERAVGQKLNEYTRQQIFVPLHMANTGWSLHEIDPAKHATLYVGQMDLSIPIPNYEVTTYPDGGVRTSASDLSKLFIALVGDGSFEGTSVLDKRWAEEMTRFQFSAAAKPDNVKLNEINSGLFWESKFNVTRMGHNGSDPGVRTWMMSSLDRDFGVILFANTSLSGPQAKHHDQIFLALWKKAEELKHATGARP